MHQQRDYDDATGTVFDTSAGEVPNPSNYSAAVFDNMADKVCPDVHSR